MKMEHGAGELSGSETEGCLQLQYIQGEGRSNSRSPTCSSNRPIPSAPGTGLYLQNKFVFLIKLIINSSVDQSITCHLSVRYTSCQISSTKLQISTSRISNHVNMATAIKSKFCDSLASFKSSWMCTFQAIMQRITIIQARELGYLHKTRKYVAQAFM